MIRVTWPQVLRPDATREFVMLAELGGLPAWAIALGWLYLIGVGVCGTVAAARTRPKSIASHLMTGDGFQVLYRVLLWPVWATALLISQIGWRGERP